MAAIAAAAVLLGGCGAGGDDGDDAASAPPVPGCDQVEAPAPKRINLKPPTQRVDRGERLTAAVTTSCGSFTIALDTSDSPKTVSSFAHLAKAGAYDGTAFDRVVPDFVIQGGDPVGDGSGPGYTVDEPPPPDAEYTRYTVAMAKSKAEPPGRSGSEFFIVTSPADAGLPPQYALLGKVAHGKDTVTRISKAADPSLGPEGGPPRMPIVIDRVRIEG
jgi:peptidyl-prolyl cis-trans isomerase B (cyclophilin B)